MAAQINGNSIVCSTHFQACNKVNIKAPYYRIYGKGIHWCPQNGHSWANGFLCPSPWVCVSVCRSRYFSLALSRSLTWFPPLSHYIYRNIHIHPLDFDIIRKVGVLWWIYIAYENINLGIFVFLNWFLYAHQGHCYQWVIIMFMTSQRRIDPLSRQNRANCMSCQDIEVEKK